MKMVFGKVGKSGNISNRGSGDWAVSKVESGRYEVRFTPPLPNVPVILITPAQPTEGSNKYSAYDTTTDDFTVDCQETHRDRAADTAFSFLTICRE